MGLLRQLPQEECRHGPAEADMDLADPAFSLGVVLHPEIVSYSPKIGQ